MAASLQENMRAENKKCLADAVSMFALQAKVDEALSAFGGGLDPAVNAAVARIRARVDERAALVAERVAE